MPDVLRNYSLLGTGETVETHPSDDERWLSIITQNTGLIRAYMCRVTRDADERADLIQSALTIAWFTRGSGADSTETREWLVDCCRQARREWTRSNRPIPAMVSPDAVVEMSDEAEKLFAADDESVWRLLATLAPRQQEAVVYRVVESFPVRETATAMGCREGTVKAHLHAALCCLRERAPAAWNSVDD